MSAVWGELEERRWLRLQGIDQAACKNTSSATVVNRLFFMFEL
jgi:hypothetical protein